MHSFGQAFKTQRSNWGWLHSQEDQWAGEEGMDEWIVDGGDLLKRQVEFCRELQGDSYKGFSLYNYGTLFQPEQSVKELVEEEKENLKTILK